MAEMAERNAPRAARSTTASARARSRSRDREPDKDRAAPAVPPLHQLVDNNDYNKYARTNTSRTISQQSMWDGNNKDNNNRHLGGVNVQQKRYEAPDGGDRRSRMDSHRQFSRQSNGRTTHGDFRSNSPPVPSIHNKLNSNIPPAPRSILSNRASSPPIPAVKNRLGMGDGPPSHRNTTYRDAQAINPPVGTDDFIPFIRSHNVLHPEDADNPIPVSREPSGNIRARKAYIEGHQPASFGEKMSNIHDPQVHHPSNKPLPPSNKVSI